jgi:hypothetical protein
LQVVAYEQQAPAELLQNKSCLKTYRRFFIRSGMCHILRVHDFDHEGTEGAKSHFKWLLPPFSPRPIAEGVSRIKNRKDPPSLTLPSSSKPWRTRRLDNPKTRRASWISGTWELPSEKGFYPVYPVILSRSSPHSAGAIRPPRTATDPGPIAPDCTRLHQIAPNCTKLHLKII